jgi:AcrR family transcriptional regulator
MSEPAQASRRYDSSGRQAAAAETRRRIVRAASDLFVEHGWAGTTVAAVAEVAGVSAPTVFAGFGSKALLLKAAIDVALAGDDRAVPVSARPTARWVAEAPSAAEVLARYAVMMGELAQRAGPIYEVLLRAAGSDPELSSLLADLEQQRLRAASGVAAAVQERGGLPPGRTVDEARDVIWLCNAPELYVNLVRRRRWSTKRYVAWARDALTKLVLEPPVPEPEPGHSL